MTSSATNSVLNYYIGYTPSCNKDAFCSTILGPFATKEEAEQKLRKYVSRYIDDMGDLELFKVESYSGGNRTYTAGFVNSYQIDTSALGYPYIQQYVFNPDGSEDYEVDYEAIMGNVALFACCDSYTPSFWIIGADSEILPGEIKKDLAGLIW